MPSPAFTEEDLTLLVEHRLSEAIDSGHPPTNLQAWMRKARQQELDNESARPGWIARATRPLRLVNGQRVTFWRCVRGTHGQDWIYDPTGTDDPPPASFGYSLDIAKADWEARQKRRHLRAV